MNKTFEVRLAALGFRADDVEERFILGSGRGGQKLQKTSSCVWLRHCPTGTEARCQQERSQSANRELAWTELLAKLTARRLAQAAAKRDERELNQRRRRQKSRSQKTRMIESKKHRADIKARRRRADME